MPVEKEWKFILPNGFNIKDKKEHVLTVSYIEQGYLGGGARIRKMTDIHSGASHYWFGWKHKMKNSLVMEIEPEISIGDYNSLRGECISSLTKFRHRLSDTGSGVWDVDEFINPFNEESYLTLAEVEHSDASPWELGMQMHPGLMDIPAYHTEESCFSSYSLSTKDGMEKALYIINALKQSGTTLDSNIPIP